jgi:uncharacterized protein (TIGR03382 family)
MKTKIQFIISLASLLALGPLFANDTKTSGGLAAKNFNLDVAGDVETGGSDSRSKEFQASVLPKLNEILNSTLREGRKLDDSVYALDPSKLVLQNDVDARVYFLGEGAGFRNTLGFNTQGGGVKSGDPEIIFPNASSEVSFLGTVPKDAKRTASNPLLPGDFVDIGKLGAGTKLDFFLIADGANGGKTVFSTDKSLNPDGINHVITFATVVQGYLILGFEDLLGGGDRDFNDVLFAIDLGTANLAALTGTPEPSTYMTMGLFLAGGVWVMRRRRATKAMKA